jgi:Polyketide cyclase / dehydrase and lipid transport
MDMATIEGEVFIERPPGEVFDFVADERHEPKYNPQMVRVEKLTSGPVREGTTYLAWMRSGTRTSEMLIETTQFDPPRILSSSTTLKNMTIHGTLKFSPDGEGTRMSWSWQLEPTGLLRMLRPVVDLLGRRQEIRIWMGLKDVLEGEKAEKVNGAQAL